MKPVLVSGVQPTGRIHIGVYLGMLKNAVALQNSGKYRCHYFIADLHSLTSPIHSHAEKFSANEEREGILEVAADALAAGLDPQKSLLFQQSQVAAHSELMWILNTITPMGELRQMTQFKDKGDVRRAISGSSGTNKERIYDVPSESANVGLFDYPVLMASDIILYDAQVVPVGEDQTQHLELTRTLVRRFNARFGETFVEPKGLLTKTPRIMSLKNPAKKMSKSEPESCIFLDDTPYDIREKMKCAVTDSDSEIKYAPSNSQKAGISNLITLYSSFTGNPIEKIEAQYKGKYYSEFKMNLAEVISDYFAQFRERKKKLVKKPSTLKKILKDGSIKAAHIADKKMKEVREKTGLAL